MYGSKEAILIFADRMEVLEPGIQDGFHISLQSEGQEAEKTNSLRLFLTVARPADQNQSAFEYYNKGLDEYYEITKVVEAEVDFIQIWKKEEGRLAILGKIEKQL